MGQSLAQQQGYGLIRKDFVMWETLEEFWSEEKPGQVFNQG